MQVAMGSCDYDTSRIGALPFINLDPSNQSTIYTAIHFTQRKSGSGLKELWESVYVEGSIAHMMNGHSYSRALCPHFLT